MKISRALLVTAFLTAGIIVVAGSAISTAAAKQDTASREAEYQQMIDQANQQLVQANQQIEQANAELTRIGQSQPNPQMAGVTENAPASVSLSIDQAAEIAKKAASPEQTMKKAPELVDYQGTVAYEVAFDAGSVYVNAASGEVLFNGTVPQKIDEQMAAKVASDYLQDKNILSVDTVAFRGQTLFRVIFKSGTMVYMDETGQITYINKGGVMLADNSGGYEDDGGSAQVSQHHYDDDHEEHDDD